jgi:signal transduction histidine kinase
MSNTDWQARAEAAEKTVDVLSRKVMALYRGESASTIEKQLESSRKRQEKALQRRQLTELRAAELARYSEGLEVEVAERTRALRTVLDHVSSGLLVIDADLVAREGHSKSCFDLLDAQTVAGASLLQLLGVTDPRRESALRASIEQVYDDILPEELSVDMVPKRFPLGSKVINVDTSVIRRDGAVAGLLLPMSDVTNLERAEREARDNHALLRIVKDREAFREFIMDARELLAAAREAAAESNHVFVRRAVHTVKGNAATYDLFDVVELVHGIESGEVIDVPDLVLIERALQAFLVNNASCLEIEYDAAAEEHFDVASTALDQLRRIAASTEVVGDAVEHWCSHVTLKRADTMLGPLGTYVTKLAERLEKSVDFSLVGGETLIDTRLLRPVFQNLAHVLRNAIDHGVEEASERGEKPSRAKVTVTIGESRSGWTVQVEDDGRGVDTAEVARQAVVKGLVSAEVAGGMGEQEKLALVFRDGLSTARRTTDVSGRGVGMSAIRAAVEERGGVMSFESTRGQGTRVVLTLPKPKALRARPSVTPQKAA